MLHPILAYPRKGEWERFTVKVKPDGIKVVDERLSGLFQMHNRLCSSVDETIIAAMRSAYLQGFNDAYQATVARTETQSNDASSG